MFRRYSLIGTTLCVVLVCGIADSAFAADNTASGSTFEGSSRPSVPQAGNGSIFNSAGNDPADACDNDYGSTMPQSATTAHCAPADSHDNASHGPSRQAIRRAQRELKAHGAKLRVDGVFGPNTANAVSQYQRKHHLHTTRELDSETLERLGVKD